MLQELDIAKRFSDMDMALETKVRLSITGLAFCELNTDISLIHFLSHVKYHDLNMTVKRTIRDSKRAYPLVTYRIEEGDPISLEVSGSTKPEKISTTGEFPLQELVNLRDLHGGAELDIVIPPGMTPPNILSVRHCSFFTQAMHPFQFFFREGEKKSNPELIGYVMGGVISAPDEVESVVTIRCPSLPQNELVLPARNGAGQEMVYEILFDNHCYNPIKFKEELPDQTDFSFYYDILKERDAPERKIELVAIPPTEGLAGPGGTGADVAACNVAVKEPPSG